MMGVRNKIKQVALLRIMSESLVKKRKITNLKKRAMKMNMMKSRKAKAKMSMMLKNSKITMMKN
jgi:hypothetical protein